MRARLASLLCVLCVCVVPLLACACRGANPAPRPAPTSNCPGAPGCGCRNESGEVACELAEVTDRASATSPGATSVVARYRSDARPFATGVVAVDVPPAQVPSARAYYEAHRSARCELASISAPCPPTDTLTPMVPAFAPR